MSRHISSLVSSDSRDLYQRMRRIDCYKTLEAWGVNYPSGASKDAMVEIMKGNGINPASKPPSGEGVKFIPVQVTDENGNVSTEMYPEVPVHATANKDINYEAILDKVAKEQLKQDEGKDNEIEQLKAQVAKLMAMMGDKEVSLEPQIDYEAMEADELRALAKEKGIKVHHKAGKKKIIEALVG